MRIIPKKGWLLSSLTPSSLPLSEDDKLGKDIKEIIIEKKYWLSTSQIKKTWEKICGLLKSFYVLYEEQSDKQ